MSEYNNLSGTASFDVECPYKDTLVYNLRLKDKNTGDYLPLNEYTFKLEVFLNTNVKLSTTGTLSDDGYTVSFIKDTKIKPQLYGYRIIRTKDSVSTTAVRGRFKVTLLGNNCEVRECTVYVDACVEDIEVVEIGVYSGDIPYQEYLATVDAPTFTVQHDAAKLPNIKLMMVVDGVSMRWEKLGITRNETTGTFTFPFEVNEEIIFEAK